RQVLRDGQHNGVVQGVCFFVEAAGLCLAYTGVDGWEQGKNQALACVVCWGDVGQVRAHNGEVWKSFANCWKLACGLCWIGLKSDISHDYDDTSVFTSSDDRMQKKIRNHTTGKVPFMLLAGARDAEADAVSFRFLDGSQANGIQVDEAVELIANWIAERENTQPNQENIEARRSQDT